MKKVSIIFLAILTLLALTACAGNPKTGLNSGEIVTQYKLPDTGGDTNSWFYEKYDTKVNTIDGVWFDIIDSDIVSDWCNKYDQERKAGTLDTTYPMLIKFIMDCNIPEETCREVMGNIKTNEEKFGVEQIIHLTADEIHTVYSGSTKQINETFASEYCIVVNGNIFTPEWLLNHPISEYQSEGITYSQFKDKLDSKYSGLLEGNVEFIEIYERKLRDLNNK